MQAVVKTRRILDHLVAWMQRNDDAEGSKFGPAIAEAVRLAERDAREGVPGPEAITQPLTPWNAHEMIERLPRQ